MMMTSASTSAIGGGSRQAQENILKVRLLGGDVDDAQTGRRQRAEHIPGVHPAPVVADRDDPGRGPRYPAETGRLGERSEKRRVGPECDRPCRYRWSPALYNTP